MEDRLSLMSELIYALEMKGSFQDGMYESSCYVNALREVLQYYNPVQRISITDLFVAINGFNIKFDRDKDYLGLDVEENNNFSFFQGGLQVTAFGSERGGGQKEIIDFIEASLKKNQPVICFVESQCLKYHTVYLENDSQLHSIIINGMDVQQGQISVIDSHIRINDNIFERYYGELPIMNLVNGLKYAWILEKKEYNFSSDKMLSCAFLGIRSYLKPECDGEGLNGSAGFYRYLNYSLAISAELNREEFFKLSLKLHYDIKINGPCLVIRHLLALVDQHKGRGLEQSLSAPLEQLRLEWVNVSHLLLASGMKYNKQGFCSTIARAAQLHLRLNDQLTVMHSELQRCCI